MIRWVGWYSLWTSFLLMLVFSRYAVYMDFPSSILGWSYLTTTWIGHGFFLTLLFFPLLLLIALLIPKKPFILTIGVLLSSLSIALVILDTLVFDQYRFHINGFVISLLINDTDGQIFDFSITSQLMALAGVGAIVGIQFLVAKVLFDRLPSHPRLRYVMPSMFMMILASHGIHAYADALYKFDVTKQARFFPVHFPTTAQKQFAKWGVSDPAAAEKARLLKVGSGLLDYPKKPLQCVGGKTKKNILLIAVDSWRYDTANDLTSPNVARFADRYGTRFVNHYSGGNGTRTGVFSLFYGIPGTYWDAMKSSATPPVLIQELQKQDYDLGIFANARLTSPAFDKTVFSSVPGLRTETDAPSSPLRDIKLTDEWLEWLDNQQHGEQPFFGFLFYDAPHSYSAPEGYPEIFTPAWKEVNYLKLNNDFDPKPYLNRYKNAVHFTDSQIGRVLDDLESRGLLENTLVVITADHGQEFNDLKKNYWGHGGNFSDAQVKVPMIVAGEGFPKGGSVDKTTSHFDLVPTMLQGPLGCENSPRDFSSGHHLLEHEGRNWVIAGSVTNYGVIQQDKITVTYHSGQYEVVTPKYDPLGSDELDIKVMSEVMKEIGRFYK